MCANAPFMLIAYLHWPKLALKSPLLHVPLSLLRAASDAKWNNIASAPLKARRPTRASYNLRRRPLVRSHQVHIPLTTEKGRQAERGEVETGRQTDKQTNRQPHKQTDTHKHRHTDSQSDTLTPSQRHPQTQTPTLTHSLTHSLTHTDTPCFAHPSWHVCRTGLRAIRGGSEDRHRRHLLARAGAVPSLPTHQPPVHTAAHRSSTLNIISHTHAISTEPAAAAHLVVLPFARPHDEPQRQPLRPTVQSGSTPARHPAAAATAEALRPAGRAVAMEGAVVACIAAVPRSTCAANIAVPAAARVRSFAGPKVQTPSSSRRTQRAAQSARGAGQMGGQARPCLLHRPRLPHPQQQQQQKQQQQQQ